jgi:hypothetical protein
MFNTGLAVMGAGAATASAGGGDAPPAALSPGGHMAGPNSASRKNPLAPTHPAGIAFCLGVGATAAFILLWYSLPS